MNTQEMQALRAKAARYGREDAQAGEDFFPEQCGLWAQVHYTMAFLAVKPGNEAAQMWVQVRMARQEARRIAALNAEEYEMDEREEMAAAGVRFVGGSPVLEWGVAA